jgi:cold shock CspA family protein
MSKMKGTITYWNSERAFGFITTITGARYFFHINNFENGHQPVLDGQVAFEIGPGIATGKPAQAVRVGYAAETAETSAKAGS